MRSLDALDSSETTGTQNSSCQDKMGWQNEQYCDLEWPPASLTFNSKTFLTSRKAWWICYGICQTWESSSDSSLQWSEMPRGLRRGLDAGRGVTFGEDKLAIKPSDLKALERMRATSKQSERDTKAKVCSRVRAHRGVLGRWRKIPMAEGTLLNHLQAHSTLQQDGTSVLSVK